MPIANWKGYRGCTLAGRYQRRSATCADRFQATSLLKGSEVEERPLGFVYDHLSEAQKRLIAIRTDALLTDAAKALSGHHTELAVVCDADGKAVGVITRADVVRRIAHCEGAACRATAAAAMTQDVVSCGLHDHVSDVWSKMRQHGVRRVPIVDDELRPLGIISARDVLQALMINAVNEAELLRDYILGIEYY